MAVTVHIKQGDPELSLTVDAPRVVIGRSKSCEVQLPDPTVSARHASLRLDEGRPVVFDEGSTNGVLIDGLRIPARTAWPIDDGQILRVGRVWLAISLSTAAPPSGAASPARRARAVAHELLVRQLADLGEEVSPAIEVIDGPDAGLRIELLDGEREYTLGRGADMPLSDPALARQHAIVWQECGEWRVRDGGSRAKSELSGTALEPGGRVWRDGEVLNMGASALVLRSPLAEAFEDALGAADVRMRSEEREQPPPGGRVVPEPPPEKAPPPIDVLLPVVEQVLAEPSGRGLGAVDVLVALLAVGMLCVSAAGLWWVLHG
jgi:pSer/pThr/pTyr-binding forkhead associated (FHA) protein